MPRTAAPRLAVVAALASIAAVAFLVPRAADACTTFRISSRDGAILVGRSMELGMPLDAARFPAFKNREIAVLGGKPYWLVALEHFDLRNDGGVVLFRAEEPWRAPPRSRP